jgi:hypothetical protein
MQVEINGVVDTQENKIDMDKFLDLFIDFVEVNGFVFAGVMVEVEE